MANRANAWLPWVSVALLTVLCAFVAVLQYRWTGEITIAERARLQEDLQQRLFNMSRDFNDEVSSALRDAIRSGKSGDPILQSVAMQKDSVPDQTDPSPETLRIRVSPDDAIDATLNLSYIRNTTVPQLITKYLSTAGTVDYDVEVVTNTERPQVVYASVKDAPVWREEDASAPLLDIRIGGPPGGRGRRGDHSPEPPDGFKMPFPRRGGRGPGFGDRGPERWRILARHKAGSLEALVAASQRRNLTISAVLLLLIVATVGILLRYTRKTQRLAEMQMNFVTGVSHELRTPLTVIRTAAYNLRNPEFRRSDEKVNRYGEMIANETGKLESLVNQVMRFASANAGHAIRTREELSVADLIAEEIADVRQQAAARGIRVEEDIDADLPRVWGDRDALRQVVRNLIDNALKYGAASTPWIGVGAQKILLDGQDGVEVTIADKGPGIPADERSHIFEPFFRGQSALRDQVHGTGLGLNLVKSIVETHGGVVSVRSDSAGTRFFVRLPGAQPKVKS